MQIKNRFVVPTDYPDLRSTGAQSGDRWVLIKDYKIEWQDDGIEFEITIPKGFRSDGSSLASLTTNLIWLAERGPHDPAWLVHDYIYANKGELQTYKVYYIEGKYTQTGPVSKADADRLFYELLKKTGVRSWSAWIAYKAVEIGGRFWWRR